MLHLSYSQDFKYKPNHEEKEAASSLHTEEMVVTKITTTS